MGASLNASATTPNPHCVRTDLSPAVATASRNREAVQILAEFCYGWRQQIQPLAAAGFRVVAPDMRGYNLSSKPDGVAHLGQDDGYLGPDLAEPDHDDVPNLDRVERLLGASHWVHHDAAELVTQLLTDAFAPAQPGKDDRGTSTIAGRPG